MRFIVIGILGVCIVSLLILIYRYDVLYVDVSGYSGDGQIRPIGFGLSKGYEISFGEIPWNKPLEVEYLMMNLPRTKLDLWITLKCSSMITAPNELPGAYVRIRAYAGEKLIFDESTVLSESTVSSSWRKEEERKGSEVYLMSWHIDGSDFAKGERIRVRIEYKPDLESDFVGTFTPMATVGGYY